MEFYVVADEDTVTGFRYAGVDGVAVSTPVEAARELDRLVQERRELLIITTEQVVNTVRDKVNAIRFGGGLPLIVEIPGLAGPSAESPSLVKLIREAVGIKF